MRYISTAPLDLRFCMTPEQTDTLEAQRHAATLDPNNALLQANFGTALIEASQFDEALSVLQRILAIDPEFAPAHNAMGRLYYNIGTPEQALAAYERAIALDPHDDGPYFGIGILLTTKLGDYAGALAAYQRGLAQNPSSRLLADSIATTYARMGRLAEAQALLEAACQQDPTDTYALSWLQIIHLQARRYDAVIDLGERMLAIEPANDPQRMMGYALLHIGQLDKAIAHLSEALTLKPQDYEVRGALAHALATVGTPAQKQAAEEHYRIAQTQAMQDDAYGQACFEAVSGNVDRAIELLTTGLSKDQVMSGWARIDPEFSFISHDPRFGALVNKVPILS